MAPLKSRRQFIINLGSLAALSALPSRAVTPDSSEIRFAYASITWGGQDLQAITEIGEVGFRGIQLRAPILKSFGDKPSALADLLKQHGLRFVALSGGGPSGYDYREEEVVAAQVKHSTFLRAAGGLYLQMTDSSRPKDRKPGREDFKKLGRVLSEVGKRAADMGVVMAYHNHMNSLGEAPGEVDQVMDAADPRYAKLLLDVAHYAQGGGDPAKAILKYRDRILFLHIKDVETLAHGAAGEESKSYRFVELGRGRVDLPAVFAALKEIKFRGWAVVELDSVPDETRTPKESAIISKRYIEEKLRMKI
ncbi:MAG TPA: sugar phosphate isomerase/epimerase [Blastocatellia bacterium]|nr:sugar phosphate isomerase/epimerase [Blastocatellia bacterium]